MKKILIVMAILSILILGGCSGAFQDTNIKCIKRIDWNENLYLSCNILITKTTEKGYFSYSENYDCNPKYNYLL